MKEYPILRHPPEPGDQYESYTIWVQLTMDDDLDLGVELLSPLPYCLSDDETCWLGYEVDNVGIKDVVIGGGGSTVICGERVSNDGESFALECGIAPYQPFAVRCWYETWRDYEGDWDARINTQIVAVKPLDPIKAARRFEQFMKRRERTILQLQERRRKLKQIQYEDVESMALKYEYYFSDGSHWDDMAMPSGIQIALVTRRDTIEPPKPGYWRGMTMLLTGRDDKGNWDAAKARLFEQMREKYPHVDPTKLKMLNR